MNKKAILIAILVGLIGVILLCIIAVVTRRDPYAKYTDRAHSIEPQLQAVFEQYIRSEYANQYDIRALSFEALAHEGNIACGRALIRYLVWHFNEATQHYEYVPTPVYGEDGDFYGVRFLKENSTWKVDQLYTTSCSRCNGWEWDVRSPYDICPIVTEHTPDPNLIDLYITLTPPYQMPTQTID